MCADSRQLAIWAGLAGVLLVIGCDPPPLVGGTFDAWDVGAETSSGPEDGTSGNNGNDNDDNNGDNGDNDNNGNDNGGTEDTGVRDATKPELGDVPTVEFNQVADIIRTSCALANCHGNPANSRQGFQIGANGDNASNEQIESALHGETQNSEIVPLVVPYKPFDSGIYQALKGINGRAQMPFQSYEDFPQRKVETVKNWILQGAPYD